MSWASHMLCDAIHPHFDVSPIGHLADAGDLLRSNISLERMRSAMAPLVESLIREQHMVWLGQTLAVLRFGAHGNTWTEHFGEPSEHGTWVYEAIQEGLVCWRLASPSSASDRRPSTATNRST
jgi:agmatinase